MTTKRALHMENLLSSRILGNSYAWHIRHDRSCDGMLRTQVHTPKTLRKVKENAAVHFVAA